MNRGSAEPNWILIVGGAVIIIFLLVVVVPAIFSLVAFVQDPNIDDFSNLVEMVVTPWWLPIAAASGVLFVLMVVILRLVGAEGIL